MQLTLDRAALRANYRALNDMCGGRAGAVVKANGYGLGAENVGKTLWEAGARAFFVATPNEAETLIKTLPQAKIYDLSGLSVFLDNPAIPVCNSLEQLAEARKNPLREYALQFDIGMSRLGLDLGEIALAREAEPTLLMAHLSSADEADNPINAQELKKFAHIRAYFPQARASLANTGGVLLGEDYHFDLCRPGIGLYGGAPFLDAKAVFQISLPVIQTRRVQAGTKIGYNGTFTAQKDMQIATVLGGYADGILRNLSNKAALFAEDIPCPILGRISMDAIMVDISLLKEVPKRLDLLNSRQNLNKLADIAETIPYELLTRLGSRYKRLITDED